MIKRFIIYFLITFSIAFVILNSRFVAAQISFAFSKPVQVDESVLPRFLYTEVSDKTHLPISSSKIDSSLGFIIEIPEIRTTAPIVLEQSVNPDTILSRLEDGVVHFADSPLPGEKGTAVILGHSSAYPWYKGHYGSVFALLGKLKIGDLFYIKNGDTVLTYKVSGSLVFNPLSKDPKINQLGDTTGSAIVLVSCWPVGTNYQRIAIRADLI